MIVDADRIVREVQEPGTATLRRIVDEFGPGLLRPDGSLDRAALGAIVFGDDSALRRLNAVVLCHHGGVPVDPLWERLRA